MISVVTLYISRIAIVFSRRYFELKRLIYSFAYSGLLKGIFASTLPLITIQYIFFYNSVTILHFLFLSFFYNIVIHYITCEHIRFLNHYSFIFVKRFKKLYETFSFFTAVKCIAFCVSVCYDVVCFCFCNTNTFHFYSSSSSASSIFG